MSCVLCVYVLGVGVFSRWVLYLCCLCLLYRGSGWLFWIVILTMVGRALFGGYFWVLVPLFLVVVFGGYFGVLVDISTGVEVGISIAACSW